MEKIIVYTNETCSYCKQVVKFFDDNDVKYINRVTSEFQEEFNEISNLIDMGQVPLIEYQEQYFAPARDFPNPQTLINRLKNLKKSNFSETRQLLEKVKTLNYNISQAFIRLDQRLIQIENKLNTEKDEHKSTS